VPVEEMYDNKNYDMLIELMRRGLLFSPSRNSGIGKIFYLAGKNGDLNMIRLIHKYMKYNGDNYYITILIKNIIEGVTESTNYSPTYIEILDSTLPILFDFTKGDEEAF
jgi:hypothetical protein